MQVYAFSATSIPAKASDEESSGKVINVSIFNNLS